MKRICKLISGGNDTNFPGSARALACSVWRSRRTKKNLQIQNHLSIGSLSTLASLLLLFASHVDAQTNSATNHISGDSAARSPDWDIQAEKVRAECIQNRRFVCGRVVQIVPDGLVIDSGYSILLQPPYNQSWMARGNISISKDTNSVEAATPDSVCVGLVFLTSIPKKPKVARYDYVVIHGYPAGQYDYQPVGDIHKSIRRFSASLERAVALNMKAREKK